MSATPATPPTAPPAAAPTSTWGGGDELDAAGAEEVVDGLEPCDDVLKMPAALTGIDAGDVEDAGLGDVGDELEAEAVDVVLVVDVDAEDDDVEELELDDEGEVLDGVGIAGVESIGDGESETVTLAVVVTKETAVVPLLVAELRRGGSPVRAGLMVKIKGVPEDVTALTL